MTHFRELAEVYLGQPRLYRGTAVLRCGGSAPDAVERMQLVPGDEVYIAPATLTSSSPPDDDTHSRGRSMIAFRKLYSPTVIKVVWWLTVILAAMFLIVSEYFGIRLWSIALGLGQEPTVATVRGCPGPSSGPRM